jgi:hypothetical protein
MLNRAAQPALVEHTEQRGGLSEIAMVRGAIFLALVGGAGFSAWTSFQDSSRNPLDWAVGEVHAMVTQPDDETAEEERSDIVDAHPVVLQTETASRTIASPSRRIRSPPLLADRGISPMSVSK